MSHETELDRLWNKSSIGDIGSIKQENYVMDFNGAELIIQSR